MQLYNAKLNSKNTNFTLWNTIYDSQTKITETCIYKSTIEYAYIHTLCGLFILIYLPNYCEGFPGGTVGTNARAKARDARSVGLIPGTGRSPEEGNGNPLQYCCLRNPMDRGAWQATVRGVAKSWTQLSSYTQPPPHCQLSHPLECVQMTALPEMTYICLSPQSLQ